MIKYFVSFAHLRGLGNTIVTSERKLTEQDIKVITRQIKEKFAVKEVVILNFIEMENKND